MYFFVINVSRLEFVVLLASVGTILPVRCEVLCIGGSRVESRPRSPVG
jgi:hypothetical protein